MIKSYEMHEDAKAIFRKYWPNNLTLADTPGAMDAIQKELILLYYPDMDVETRRRAKSTLALLAERSVKRSLRSAMGRDGIVA